MIDLFEYIPTKQLVRSAWLFGLAILTMLAGWDLIALAWLLLSAVRVLPGFSLWLADSLERFVQVRQINVAVVWLTTNLGEVEDYPSEPHEYSYPVNCHRYIFYCSDDLSVSYSYWHGIQVYYNGQCVYVDNDKVERFNSGPWIDELLEVYRLEESKAARADRAKFAPLTENDLPKQKHGDEIYHQLSEDGKARHRGWNKGLELNDLLESPVPIFDDGYEVAKLFMKENLSEELYDSFEKPIAPDDPPGYTETKHL